MIAEKIGMDAIDCMIMDLIQRKPSLTHARIAEIVHRSQPTIGARIKKLERMGVLKYQAGINMKVADLCFGRVELQTNNPEKAIDLVNNCPFMLNAFRLGGSTNISILLVGLSFGDLDQIVNRHFRNDPDVVKVRIDVIADVVNDFVLPIDLNLEFGELDLDSCCCGKCSC